jgi:hypothetical protein
MNMLLEGGIVFLITMTVIEVGFWVLTWSAVKRLISMVKQDD